MLSSRIRALCGLTVFFALSASAHAALQIVSPAPNATVLNSSPWVEIQGYSPADGHPHLYTRLDDHEVHLEWTKEPYSGRWLARLPSLSPGHHTIRVKKNIHRFDVASNGTEDTAARLARHFTNLKSASALGWNWGQGVFLYGLEKFADKLGESSQYVRDYQAYWSHKGAPRPDRSDLCPPALTGLALARDHGDWIGMDSVQPVADYVRFEPRTRLGAINHLGHSFLSHFFPQSIWVDSLMMYGVFAAQWGDFIHDSDMRDFGISQPLIFASVLQDPSTGLFRHAWKVKSQAPIPSSETFWLRGNGWVLVSIAEILDVVPPGSPEAQKLVEIFRKTADGLLRYQLPTGLWDSIANLPGFSYPETSGTALVSYALAKGVHRGWLPHEYLAPAKAAFAGITAMLLPELDGATMPSISGATDPGPRWMYGLVGPVKNASYGVGAYLMAASELMEEEF